MQVVAKERTRLRIEVVTLADRVHKEAGHHVGE